MKSIDIKIPKRLANKLTPGIYKNSRGFWVANMYKERKNKVIQTTELPFGPTLNLLFNLVEEHARADAIYDVIKKIEESNE